MKISRNRRVVFLGTLPIRLGPFPGDCLLKVESSHPVIVEEKAHSIDSAYDTIVFCDPLTLLNTINMRAAKCARF